jgi:hypothetical protein
MSMNSFASASASVDSAILRSSRFASSTRSWTDFFGEGDILRCDAGVESSETLLGTTVFACSSDDVGCACCSCLTEGSGLPVSRNAWIDFFGEGDILRCDAGVESNETLLGTTVFACSSEDVGCACCSCLTEGSGLPVSRNAWIDGSALFSAYENEATETTVRTKSSHILRTMLSAGIL